MKKRILSAAALALLAWTSPSGAQSGDFLAALTATRASDAENATRFLAGALGEDPGQEALLRQQMRILTIEGRFAEALPFAEEFLAIDRNDELALSIIRIEAMAREDWQTALSTLPFADGSRLDMIVEAIAAGALYTGAGDLEQALASIEQGLDAIGFAPLGNYARGLIYASQNMDEEASDAFAAFIARDIFQYPRMAENAAYALERTGDETDARIVFEALIGTGVQGAALEGLDRLQDGTPQPDKLRPTVKDIYTELMFVIARLLAAQDEPSLAYEYAQQIGYLLTPQSSLFPGYTEVIASSLLELERFEDAEEAYAMLETVDEFRLAALLGQVQALSDQERYDDALAVLDEAQDILGGAPGIARQRGVIHFRAEQFAEARAAFSDWRTNTPELGPGAARSLFLDGISAYRLDQFKDMEEAMQLSLELRPEDPNVMNFLAYSWIERGLNLEEGFEMLNRAVELEPNSGAIIDSLGWAYYQLGDYDNAVPNLEKAFQINPWSWEIAEHVGDAYWQVGRTLEAEFFWRRALELPDIPEKHVDDINQKLEEGIIDAAPES